MGVDISTWRARVGMFSPRTSQKSLLIFRAQMHSPSANHHQAPGPTPINSSPVPQTGICESGSSQQDAYIPNLAQTADKPHSQVAWIWFSYIFQLFIVLSVSLFDSQTELGYLEQMEDIVQTACAMLDYAGGVITLNPKTASTAGTDKQRDEWVDKIQKQLESVIQKEISGCIEIKTDNIQAGHIEIWLRKSWKFITYKLPLYVRRGNGTHDGDISMITGNVVTKPLFVSMVAGIQWNQLNHRNRFPLSEGLNLEFKCYKACNATSLLAKITNDEIRGEPKLIKTLLAFVNTEGGGDAIIGIKEVQGAPILEGQKLSAADEEIVRKGFDKLMKEGLNGEQRIWPSTPQCGSEWAINFYPLINCPSNDRHVLIHIRVNQVAGYVLGDEPEAYTMTPEGNIRHVPLSEWKNCIKPKSIKSVPELLKLGQLKQGNEEDNSDDEQFKQLLNDLKKHRVTPWKNIKSASWTKDNEDSQDDIVKGVSMDTCVEEVSTSELLRPSCPETWVPDKTILDRWVTKNHPGMMECVDAIAQSHQQEAVVIGTKCLERLFPSLVLQYEFPEDHAFDFLALSGNAELDLWIVFENCAHIVSCKKYTNSAIRILRSQLLSYIHQHTDTEAVKLVIRVKVWSIADNCIKYETTGAYTESTVELPVLQKAIAYCLLQGKSHIKNRLGEDFLTTLTKDQLHACLNYDCTNVMVFQGPPGSGKTIIAHHLCEREAKNRNLSKDKILYICPCQPLAEFMKFQRICDVEFTKTKYLVHTIKKALANGILLIIVDDAHLFQCSKRDWTKLLKLFKPVDDRKSSTEIHLALFLDPEYQNFQGDKTKDLEGAMSDFNKAYPFSKVFVHEPFRKMFRNSRDIFGFFKTNAEKDSFSLTCSHNFQGDGVSVSYTSEDFFRDDRNNPVLKITEEIVGTYNFEENFTYQETDITILVDSNGKGEAEKQVEKLQRIFHKFYPEAKIQRASQFPIHGIVIEELRLFSGLDTRVCILVLTCKKKSIMSDPRYKCFVASRGITKLVFLLHGDTVGSSFKQLKFSEEQQWRQLTRQLLKEIPEKGTSKKWLKTNVPETECWHKTKPVVMLRCQEQIQSGNVISLADWMERNIQQSWRQDAQFVRTMIMMIGSVNEGTIHSLNMRGFFGALRKSKSGYEVDLKELRSFLSALNCLYGAPEILQHQALDSVYDCMESPGHPENILQPVLRIMWFDGYISRQVMLSWFNDMDQTKRQACKIKLQGKDVGEQIQERMRARQDVKGWMRDTTQLGYYWYDSPHYQRVALHALCQLAVTWQGDKRTVDKDLLFYYIPQLFCNTSNGLQFLYAVQCVLHHLQNPTGLAVAVFQAVLTNSRLGTEHKPVITTADWNNWIITQNPVYDEGRDIIQEQGQLLDLIVLVCSGVTLTEINGWICTNIRQDHMLDAFIIAAECLLNRGEEMSLIKNWISQNVPANMKTAVQYTLINIIMQGCLHRIKYIEEYILPAWRQDLQFLRAAVKAVCERTIHSDQIDFKELSHYLGALNCLYGAPESLQLQALDSVYDYVETLENPDKVLQEVLDIMWSDGYISRQLILSWSRDMGQISVMMLQGILAVSKKDLGQQIQERMRAKQEVREWMGYTTQLGYYWDDSAHYLRVALHALCQLAVTWQGDKCAVDKDLLFHYIPQLFCNTLQKIQLLYAVQCVVYELSNPSGLAESVLEVLVSPTPDRPEPIITESHLEKWRKTKHPAYEEGRESMLLAITNLSI